MTAQPVREATLGDILLELADMRRDIREIKGDGKETRLQVTRTNGRVTQIESDKRIEEALRKQRAEHLAESAEQATARLNIQAHRHEERTNFWRGCALILFGAGVSGAIPHLFSLLGIA